MKFSVTFRWRADFDPVDAGVAETLYQFASRIKDPFDLADFVCAVLGNDWKEAMMKFKYSVMDCSGQNIQAIIEAVESVITARLEDSRDIKRDYHYVTHQDREVYVVIMRPWPGLSANLMFWRSIMKAAKLMQPEQFWGLLSRAYAGEFDWALADVRQMKREAGKARRPEHVAVFEDVERQVQRLRGNSADVLVIMEQTFDCLGLGSLNTMRNKQ